MQRTFRFVSTAATIAALCTGCGDDSLGPVSTADLRVHQGRLVQRHYLTGTFEAVESAEVKVPHTNQNRLQIQWIIPDGSVAGAGERVLEFDNTAFISDLDAQQTAVQSGERSLLQSRAQGEATLKEAEAAVERSRIALAKARLDSSVPESLKSRYDYRNSQLALAKAQADYATALAGLRNSEASVTSEILVLEEQHSKVVRDLGLAKEAVATLVLTAPKKGIGVVAKNPWEDRKFQVGDMVYPGWTILGIPDLDQLQVRASLSDVDDGHLTEGMNVRCTPDIEPDLHLVGRISEITPIAREQRVLSDRRGFDVTIDLDETPGDTLLLPGMSVRVEAETRGEEALLIPRVAVDLSSSPPRARRRNGSWVEIHVGGCSAQHCVLLDGLEEGALLDTTAGYGS